jgi:hypothetical protein
MKDSLLLGLTDSEADQFISLVNKMVVPKDQIEAIEAEFEAGIPFEGGVSAGEALVML